MRPFQGRLFFYMPTGGAALMRSAPGYYLEAFQASRL